MSATANGPAVLTGVSLATRRRWAQILPLAAFSLVTAQLFPLIQSVGDEPPWLTFGVNLLGISAAMA